MTKHEDGHLWKQYREAVEEGNGVKANIIASDIIRLHTLFFASYARDTAFRDWDVETRKDYLAELLAIAAAKLPLYDRDAVHAEGRRASFITFVKPYLKMVRYKMEGSRRPMKIGHETVRLSAAIARFESTRAAAGLPAPTNVEVSEHLTDLFGKRVTPTRVPRLRKLPSSQTFEMPSDDGDYVDPKTEAAMPVDLRPADPADIVTDQDERDRARAAVNAALEELGEVTELEQAIIFRRLMAETPADVEELALDFNVTEMEVVDVEFMLVKKLRNLLA